MRHFVDVQVLVLAAVVASGCALTEVVKTEDIPTAGVRFINAVPDSAGAFGLDFRFVDLVESNAHFRITYRNGPQTAGGVTAASQTQFKNARAGSRHFVIFLDDTLQQVAQTKLKDTTVTLEAGSNYTAILWGAARAGQMKLTFFKDMPADPGASVALRVFNATNAPIDVRQYAQGGTAPTTATWAGVGALTASAFVTATPGNIMFNVRQAGSETAMFSDLLALQGQANTVDIEGTPGTTRAGSAISLIVFPPSTVGARTPQTAPFLVPAGAFVWDKRPTRTSP